MKIYIAIKKETVMGIGRDLRDLMENLPLDIKVKERDRGGWEVFVDGIRDSVTYDEVYEEGDVRKHFASDRMVRILRERFGVYVYKAEQLY